MKRLWFALGLGLCLALSACSSQQVDLHTAEGKKIPLSSLQGKWVVLNYWASWCHNCRSEMKQLNQFYREHQADGKVKLYGVDFMGEQGHALLVTLRKMGIHFPVLSDNPAQIYGIKPMQAVPVTIIISPKGKIAKTLLGPQTKQGLDKVLKRLQHHETAQYE